MLTITVTMGIPEDGFELRLQANASSAQGMPHTVLQYKKNALEIHVMSYILCVTATFFLLLATSSVSAGVDQVFQLNSTRFTYNFNITILNDGIVEVAEEISVTLTHATQKDRIDLTPDMTTVNIMDDDGNYIVSILPLCYVLRMAGQQI